MKDNLFTYADKLGLAIRRSMCSELDTAARTLENAGKWLICVQYTVMQTSNSASGQFEQQNRFIAPAATGQN